MSEDLYNHIKKFKNRFENFKTGETLRVGVGKKAHNIELNINNRDLVVKWINHKKLELENVNGYEKEAQVRYYNTLYKQLTTYMVNVLYWFNHKNLQDITSEDIKKIYVGLEEGSLATIKGRKNLSYRTRKDFYGRVFKGGFFKFIGKDKMAEKVIKRKFVEASEVKFFEFKILKIITDNTATNSHRLAFWLMFDTGIEVKALCQLTKKDFEWIKEEKDSYYMLHVEKNISKKSRRKRDIYVHFNETNVLLKTHLKRLENDEKLFNFKPPALYHALKKVVDEFKLTTRPGGKSITLKDFRSSMATYFLSQGFSTDFVKQRLGHAPSSTEIDRYVNYLGISQKKQRKKAKEIELKDIQDKYEKLEEQLRHVLQQNNKQAKEIKYIRENWKKLTDEFNKEERFNMWFTEKIRFTDDKDLPDWALDLKRELMKPGKPWPKDKPLERYPLYEE